MIIMGAMPAQHLSGVSHYRRRSRQAEHDFAGAVGTCLTPALGLLACLSCGEAANPARQTSSDNAGNRHFRWSRRGCLYLPRDRLANSCLPRGSKGGS
jgi:hypothetical protein